MKNILAVAAVTVALSGIAAFAAQPENVGTVNITVLDQNGALVQDAPVYIYGEQKTKFTGGKEVPGTTTLSMPAGNYRISAAIVMKTGDYLDRFASNEAHVEVIPGDNTVIVLTLKPLADAMTGVGYAQLHSMGFGSDIASNLN